MISLGLDPVKDTRDTFRSLVEGMSKPGTIQKIPSPEDYAVLSTLVDNEVSFYSDDQKLKKALKNQGRLKKAEFEDAEIIHLKQNTDKKIVDAYKGTLKEPSLGATVVFCVENIQSKTNYSSSGSNNILNISGPGVSGVSFLSVSLSEKEIYQIIKGQDNFPKGIDVILTQRGGNKVTCLPRSVEIEVA